MPIDRNTAQYITGNPQQPTQSSAPGIWDIDEQGSAQAAGRWPLPPNVVQRSLRFNSADSAYLSRTPATASNRKTWTWSGWVKRASLGANQGIFSCAGTSNTTYMLISFDNNDKLYVGNYSAAIIVSSAVYRDLSAWYHIVVALDTTQGVAANRLKVYVNGTEISYGTDSKSTYLTINSDQGINQAVAHSIGRETQGATYYLGGYMAEVNFIDGQALTPSSFGQTDAQTGQWIPLVYSGSYGTNGFRLQFLDNSGTTATTLGKDTSGMGNNWTPNNLSVTAGTGNDSLRDVPMNYYSPDNGLGGEVIGDYCTLNPLQSSATLANGNLFASVATTSWFPSVATMGISSGKWYWEILINTDVSTSGNIHVGIVPSNYPFASGNYIGNTATSYAYRGDGQKYNNNSASAYGASLGAGSLVGVALDLDAGTITFYKNNVSQGVAFSSLSGTFFPAVSLYSASGTTSLDINFGQRPFAYTAPSGFKCLCTQNLPWTGTITTSGTFTGNASTDGPFVYLNGIPTAMTINGNAVTFGTQADKLSNGFKVRSSSSSYNASGSNTYSVSTTGNQFSKANAQANP